MLPQKTKLDDMVTILEYWAKPEGQYIYAMGDEQFINAIEKAILESANVTTKNTHKEGQGNSSQGDNAG